MLTHGPVGAAMFSFSVMGGRGGRQGRGLGLAAEALGVTETPFARVHPVPYIERKGGVGVCGIVPARENPVEAERAKRRAG